MDSSMAVQILILSIMAAILSWNVNGLREINKIEKVFQIGAEKKVDILILQETFWDENIIQIVKQKWKGDIYYSNSENKRKGVAILVSRKFEQKTEELYKDKDGRILQIRVHNENQYFDIVCVYAPNNEKERTSLFEKINNLVSDEIPTIIIGDFNMIQSPLDKAITMEFRDDKSRNQLWDLYSRHNAVDLWRYKYPNKRVFSRQQWVLDQYKQSRIDFAIVSKSLLKYVGKTYYIHTQISDHNMFYVCLDMAETERGQGLWIHNNSLLDDTKYCEKIINLINKEKMNALYTSNKLVWWDNLKYWIKRLSKQYSFNKAREKNKKYWDLQKQIEIESRRLSENPNYDMTNLKELQLQFERLEEEKCRGAILRAKAHWALDGERNTSFFLGLEKQRQKNNNVRELILPNGETIKDMVDILQEEHRFYKKLYKCENIDENVKNIFLNEIDNQLCDNDKINCDSEIMTDEMTESLKAMKKNKSPGSDGLTTEFYLKFWNIIAPILKEVIDEIDCTGTLSRTMKKGILTLIYKNRGNKNELKNYRPISLLNVDYKILARVLSNRLKLVIESIINKYQTCCIPNRDIADTIASIRDIITYCDNEKTDGYIIKIDQEKAFDRVEHKYLFDVLKQFGFGKHFIHLVETLYKDIHSAVKCNGHISAYFPVERSIRQGCPLSAMLYVIAVEPLALNILKHTHIRGIDIPDTDESSILFQHADDITLTLKDKQSIKIAFQILFDFQKASGSKINIDKCEILCLGNAERFNAYGMKELDNIIQILGVYLGTDLNEIAILNWKSKILKLRSIVQYWNGRHLTIVGRITVISNLITARVWYTMMANSVPDWVLHEIKEICVSFLWKNSSHLVSYNTIINDVNQGGLRFPDVMMKKHAFRIKFVQRYLNTQYNAVWKKYLSYFLRKYGNLNFTDEIFYMKIKKSFISDIPMFYQEMLFAWNEIYEYILIEPMTKEQLLKQPIFFNRDIEVDLSKQLVDVFIESGITKLYDIVYDVIPGFLPIHTILDIILEKYTDIDKSNVEKYYTEIIENIPESWKKSINSNIFETGPNICISIEVGIDIKHISVCNTRDFYNAIVKKKVKVPTSVAFWETKLEVTYLEKMWKQVFYRYKSPLWMEFDFKLAHNAIFTMEKLHKIGKTEDNICKHCNADIETLEHMIFECPKIKSFITYIRNITHELLYELPSNIFNKLDFKSIYLFGLHIKSERINVIFCNLMLSCARYTVYKARNIKVYFNRTIDIQRLFQFNLKMYIQQCHDYFINNKNQDMFNKLIVQQNPLITCDSDVQIRL